MAERPRARVMRDILEEHLEEVDLLWEHRQAVVFAPDWDLLDLGDHEERIEAHLDALVLAEADAVELARAALAGDEPSLAAAGTLALMRISPSDHGTAVLESLSGAEDPHQLAIGAALRHADIGPIRSSLLEIVSGDVPRLRAIVADVLAFQRLPFQTDVERLLEEGEPEIRALVFEALGRSGSVRESAVRSALESEDATLRHAALVAAARGGAPWFKELCRHRCESASECAPEALWGLAMVGDAEDLPLLVDKVADLSMAVAAIDALGVLGCASAAPVLIDAMSQPDLVHTAGGSFTRLTGAEGLDADKPLEPPDDLPEDEVDFWDDSLPPDPALVRQWWDVHRTRFRGDRRYQRGIEMQADALGPQFQMLPLQSRADVYLRARCLRPQGTQDLELERCARDQLGWAIG